MPLERDIYEQMYLAGIKPNRAYAYLIKQGYAQGAAETIAESYEMMQDELAQWDSEQKEAEAWTNAEVDEASVLRLGREPISASYLEELVARGEVIEYLEDGYIRYKNASKLPTVNKYNISGLPDISSLGGRKP